MPLCFEEPLPIEEEPGSEVNEGEGAKGRSWSFGACRFLSNVRLRLIIYIMLTAEKIRIDYVDSYRTSLNSFAQRRINRKTKPGGESLTNQPGSPGGWIVKVITSIDIFRSLYRRFIW